MMPKTVSSLGEFRLIELLKKYKGSGVAVVKGVGDDTAVVPLDARRYLLLTTDMLMEGVHFPSLYAWDGERKSNHDREALPRAVGHKALACSISDIAAMGGIPRYALVSLGVSAKLPVAFVRDIYEGMHQLAESFKVAIVGGDTIKSDKLVINIALTGEVTKNDVVYRNGARVGDQIFVTGPLGKSLSTGRHLKFIPRLKESRYLVKHFKPTAMIDISDGLAADLGHILEESRVGAVLEAQHIPCRKGARLQQALSDGEDFELLFTLSPPNAQGLTRSKQFSFYHIGEIVPRSRGLLLRDENKRLTKIGIKGYTHF